mmetsp:Transcript_1174/g.2741  ORF Transcript_1174/g.2741 Transcript_1174/m.2741 type:complete len:272 (-) Transcript_1174:188-1003(-)
MMVPGGDGADGPSMTHLERLNPGDLLKFPRRLYDHWALYLGEKDGVYYVIHLWSAEEELSMAHARVCVTPLHHVPNWEGVSVSNKWDCHYTPFQGQEAVDRAVRKLGHMGYNVALNNCEHFVTWARYGAKISDQVHAKTSPPAAALAATAGVAFGPALLPHIVAAPLCAGLLGCATVFLAKGLLRRAVHASQHWVNRRTERLLRERITAGILPSGAPPSADSTALEQPALCWTLFHRNLSWDGRRKGMPEQPPWVLVSAVTRAGAPDHRRI